MTREEDDNGSDGTPSFNRRNALQTISGGMFALTGLSGTGGASQSDTDDVPLPDVEELSGDEKKKYILKASASPEYKTLLRESSIVSRRSVQLDDSRVVRSEWKESSKESGPRHIVEFPVKSSPDRGRKGRTTDDEDGDTVVNVVFESDGSVSAKATRFKDGEDGDITIQLDVTTNEVTAQRASNQGGVRLESTTETVNPSKGVYPTDPSEVTIQGHGCGCTLKCSLCVQIYKHVCKHGCWGGASTICAVLDIGGIPGSLTCATIARTVCRKETSSWDCGSLAAQKFCNKNFDLCDAVL